MCVFDARAVVRFWTFTCPNRRLNDLNVLGRPLPQGRFGGESHGAVCFFSTTKGLYITWDRIPDSRPTPGGQLELHRV